MLKEVGFQLINEDNILELKDIDKSFFGVNVLKKINFNLIKGEVLGLCGENGAGKSTLMNILGGVLQKDAGTMLLNGSIYDPINAKIAQKSGIAFIHQELSLFSNLSIAENLFIEEFPTKGIFSSLNYKYMKETAKKYITKLGITENPDTKVSSLSMGKRQSVEIAKALIRDAKIIIFDEPTTSLSHKEKNILFNIIKQLKTAGTSIIYISHILEDIFEQCDRVAVLRDGHIIGQELTKDLEKSRVIKMMVGRELNQMYPKIERNLGKVVFEAKNLSQGNKIKNISFDLKQGEIVGFFGLMGSGRTELARAIFGLDRLNSGSVVYMGKEIKPITPKNSIRHGLAFITEDRRDEGLFMTKAIKDNLVCAYLDKLAHTALGIIDKKSENNLSDEIIKKLNIKLDNKNTQAVKNLSGGNQQKVVIGKWLMCKPKMFILDEPTRGVDVGAKYEIYTIINEMAKQGSTIIFVSSEMEELMGVCDRIIIMNKGTIKAEVSKDRYDQETIINYAIGGGN